MVYTWLNILKDQLVKGRGIPFVQGAETDEDFTSLTITFKSINQ